MLTIIILLTVLGGLGVVAHLIGKPTFFTFLMSLCALLTSCIVTCWYSTDDYVRYLIVSTLIDDENFSDYFEEIDDHSIISINLIKENEDNTKVYRATIGKKVVDCTLSSNRNKLINYVKR